MTLSNLGDRLATSASPCPASMEHDTERRGVSLTRRMPDSDCAAKPTAEYRSSSVPAESAARIASTSSTTTVAGKSVRRNCADLGSLARTSNPAMVPLLATCQRPDSNRNGSVIPHRPSDASAEAGGIDSSYGRVAGVDLPGLRPECSRESDRQIAPSTATIAQGCLLGADCRWWPLAMVGCTSAVRPQPPAVPIY